MNPMGTTMAAGELAIESDRRDVASIVRGGRMCTRHHIPPFDQQRRCGPWRRFRRFRVADSVLQVDAVAIELRIRAGCGRG
jgi:hypothetical protein